jgi:iron complex outermembrane receptor protein
MRNAIPIFSGTLLAATCLAAPAWSQEQGSGYHSTDNAEIVVTASLRQTRQDVLSSVAVISAEYLAVALRSSIGETLAHTPGVSATSFGPSASRPVLRGLQGERVRVLSNGIGSIDVSNTSVDHAPAINPLLAERVEVLRGPQSLQFGSSAIGGVVNVIDRRIPSAVPDEPVHLALQGGYASAAKERSLAGSTEVPLGGGWVGHVDGSSFKSNDLRIGGHALTPELREEALATSLLPPEPDADPDIDFAANAAVKGRLPNSSARTWNAGAGLAFIGDGGSIGIAYSRYDSLYGIPPRLATLPGQEQEAPRLHLKQDRIDARAEASTGGDFLEEISFRYAFGDYTHVEIEPDGAIGTTFTNQGMEGRLEFLQAERGGWKGVSGVQFVQRDFNVVGEEGYLPRNSTGQIGLFTLQQYETGPLTFEGGLRYETTRLESKPSADQAQFFSGSVDFNAFSAALGASYDVVPGLMIGANLSHSERSPSAEELFANGAHAGTESFEVGDPALVKERAKSIEALLRGRFDGFAFEASVFHSWFDNFIYQNRTGAIEDGLPEFQVSQADARLWGFEFLADATLARPRSWTISADAMADYVRSTIDGTGPAPRIPPFRVMGGLRAKSPHLDLGAEVEHVIAQDRIAGFETPTPAYTMVNAEIVWRPWGSARRISLILAANNIFDVEARRHASFLKDYAPLAGRDIRLTARFEI